MTSRFLLLVVLLLVSFWQACSDSGTSLNDVLIVVRNDGIAELSLDDSERLLIHAPEMSRLIEPSLSPDGETLAYVQQLLPIVVPGQPAELGMDLYLARHDGSDQRLLLEHSIPSEQIRAPVWFPEGERLLFNVQRIIDAQIVTSLEIFDIASGDRTVVVEDGFRPALSPDGARIAYVTQDESILQTLWVANADGSDPQKLAGPEDDLGSIISPRFSPDGSLIAFAGSTLPFQTISRPREVNFVSSGVQRLASTRLAERYNGLPADIWTVPADGGELVKLAPLQLDLPSLDWSDDGERLFVFAGRGLHVVYTADGTSERLGDGTFHGQLAWASAEVPAN